MNIFDFKNSVTYTAAYLADKRKLKRLKVFRIICLIPFIIFLLLSIANIFVLKNSNNSFLGFTFIFFSLFLFFLSSELFLNIKVRNPQTPAGSENIADYLDFESALAIKEAKNVLIDWKISFIDATTILYALLKTNFLANIVMARLLIDHNRLISLMESSFNIPHKLSSEDSTLEQVMVQAKQIADLKKHPKITVGDILCSLAKNETFLKRELIEKDLRPEDIQAIVDWQERVERQKEQNRKFWEYRNMVKKGSMGKEWSAGYTITLDQYSIDWTETIKKQGYPETVGYISEIEHVERILANPENNNALIIAEPGVGAKNIIYEIARKSVLEQSLPPVNNKRVVELLMPTLLASMKSIDDVEVALERICQEVATSGNIILVIDEFHDFVETEQRPGAINIAGIIAPYLPLAQTQFIGLASYAGLHRKIELNPSLLNFFIKVEVKEPSKEQTLEMLQSYLPDIEARYKKYVSYPALKKIIDLSERYITSMPFPKKAKEVLEETIVSVSRSKNYWVMPSDVDKIVAQKTEIPVGQLEAKEKTILLNLEKFIHQRIINQEEAVKEVSSALRRARSEITVRKKPMGTFLFLGPTGVGKTETSKAIAAIYFGNEERMVRLDMSEFQNLEDIPRLIGAPGQEGLLITQVRENPFSLVLLDELEKAHANILNLFLQILDEGYITDGLGRKIDFRNTIIIATSNAGYKVILEALKQGKQMPTIKEELLDHLFQEGVFRPEFINRFDAVVIFKSLSPQNLLDITQIQLQKIKDGLANKNIEFLITPELTRKIVELGYDITFGARNIKRVIQDRVENSLAEALLRGDIKRGDIITVDSKDFSVDLVKGNL